MLQKIKAVLQNKKYAKPIIISLAILSLISIYRHHKKSIQYFTQKILVETAKAEIKDIPVYLSALGTVTPDNSAIVRTQINGQLVKVNFQDGQQVKKDDVLAEIDPRTYQAQLAQYEGQLLRDQALLDNAKLDLERYQDLWRKNATSKQTLDTQIALVKQYEGTVQMDKGLVDNAKVNLSYCYIKAPFDGQTGLKLVTEGNLVQTSDVNGVAVVNKLDPISVTFSISESEIHKITKEFKKLKDLKVEIYDPTLQKIINVGELEAIDNQIDTSTGTIKMKAVFNNANYNLLPNQFVNVKVMFKTIRNAVVIPVSAVQYAPKSAYIYTVEDGKAKAIEIKVGNIDERYAVIESGVQKDQEVIISGVDRLTDGMDISTSNELGEN